MPLVSAEMGLLLGFLRLRMFGKSHEGVCNITNIHTALHMRQVALCCDARFQEYELILSSSVKYGFRRI
jgi:hypothetical protein